jgi:transcription elongation factor GreA-like protein
MARKKRKKKVLKNAEQMSPREFKAILKELRDKYQEHEELEREEEEIQEHENWFAEDLSEITKDLDFDPGKLWGD